MGKFYTKLDRRNTGFSQWKYYIDFYKNVRLMSIPFKKQEFNSWRIWCWDTWGASKELDEWLEDLKNINTNIALIAHNEHWCWQNSDYNTRIYLRTDKELSQFLLKWSP